MRILTFDIEDWFHILDNKETKSISEWIKFDSRIGIGMDMIYDILEKTDKSATFFVVGWMAEKYPDIIKDISNRGFEIGSHTHLHQLAYEQDRQTFYNDVEKSIKTIEDCTGKKVISFRAPGFSITENNKWAFEVLHELGITKDSSVFPAGRAHGGLPTFNHNKPSILEYNGVNIKEFPINTHSFLSKPIIFSGGGYFRLLPYRLIKNWTKKTDYVMTYFHPRDFDFRQPIVPGLSMQRRFKSYVGIKNCKSKLERWLNDFDFIDLNTADKKINWDKVPVVKL
ncbi:polysaccharide deacetylase family protein [Flavobacteriaceae bacterium]|nr:polysaccharide deacetylase family protein [Flavobacteriaceae bacterium]